MNLQYEVQKNAPNLILFVHGLFGGNETWNKKDGSKTILDVLKEDLRITNECDLATFNYKSTIPNYLHQINKLLSIVGLYAYKANLPIKDIADILENKIKYICPDYKKIIIIAHSMGGLVTKNYIINQVEKNGDKRVVLYLSLAVPHNGSNLANIGRIFGNQPQIKHLLPLNDDLTSLTTRWLQNINHLPKTAYFQGKNDPIVPSTSSIGFDSRKVEVINSVDDHFTILIPKPENEEVIAAIRKLIFEAIAVHSIIGNDKQYPNIQSIEKDYGEKEIVSLLLQNFSKAQVQKHNQALASKLADELKDLSIFERSLLDSKKQEIRLSDFIPRVCDENFALIWGEGGLGKSTILKLIAETIIKDHSDSVVVFCDAKNWKENYAKQLALISDVEKKTDILLKGFRSEITVSDFERLGIRKTNINLKKYILVDGLNEVPNEKTRNDINDALFEIHSKYGFQAIVTKRYAEKTEETIWKQWRLQKINYTELEYLTQKHFHKTKVNYSEKNLDFLSIAYFLDIAIKSKNDIITSYSDFLTEHVLKGFKFENREKAKKELGEIVEQAYKSNEKFIIPKNLVGKPIRTLYKNILIEEKDGFKFEHQLINELFIAHKISREPHSWNKKTFDLISFENKLSFETIQMILEQITNVELGERFLLALYDWNFYATLHCLNYVDKNYSKEFAIVIILILTEKLFDRFVHTKLKVKNYLKPLYAKFGIQGIDHINLDNFISRNPTMEKNKQDFIRIIDENYKHFENGKYNDWYKIFANKDEQPDEKTISGIYDPNSFIGWTTSNVIKRNKYNENIESNLRMMLMVCKEDIIKWRIVHAMGNASEIASVNMLFETLESNGYKWVTYGTVRSLMESLVFVVNIQELESYLVRFSSILTAKTYDKDSMYELASCLETDTEVAKGKLFLKFITNLTNSGHENFTEKNESEKWITLKEKLNGKYGNQ